MSFWNSTACDAGSCLCLPPPAPGEDEKQRAKPTGFCLSVLIFPAVFVILNGHFHQGGGLTGEKAFPVIDPVATGDNIRRLRLERGLTVRDLQRYFGFEEPRAIYKWQKGESLPTVDNLYALGSLFEIPLDQILIQRTANLVLVNEQQAEPCCSVHFRAGGSGHGSPAMPLPPFAPPAARAA